MEHKYNIIPSLPSSYLLSQTTSPEIDRRNMYGMFLTGSKILDTHSIYISE